MQNNQIFLFDNSNEDKNNFERISANNNYQNGQSNSQSLNNYNSNNSGNEVNNVPFTNYNSNNNANQNNPEAWPFIIQNISHSLNHCCLTKSNRARQH